MWIGAIRFSIRTGDLPSTGTHSLVQVRVLRDEDVLTIFPLDAPPEIGLPHESIMTFELVGPDWLPRHNDETPNYPPGYAANPMPYPSYGFEFSHGLPGHMRLQLWIDGDDAFQWMWVDLAVKVIREVDTQFGFKIWKRHPFWQEVQLWEPESYVTMSSNPNKGYPVYELDVDEAA